MPSLHTVSFVAVCVVATLGGPRASAQTTAEPAVQARDAEARALFEAGVLAYDAGHFEDALACFVRSRELSARPELLFNIAQAADRLRRDELALAAYRDFLAALPDHPQAALSRERVRFLESVVTTPEPPAVEDEPLDAAAIPSPSASIDGALLGAPAESADRAPIEEAWWLWTLVGIGVAGIGVGVGVGVALSGPEEVRPGSVGGVIMTLELR